MLVSVITPCHTPEFLDPLYESLKAQNCSWEWVVCPNGARVTEIEEKLKGYGDPRISAYRPPSGLGRSIGALKGFGFGRAKGDVLVEVDDDDWLHADCLEKVAEAAAKNPFSFIYSRSLGLWADGRHETYGAEYGWTFERIMFGNRIYENPVNFPTTARSLSEIYYVPNHVRAWTREAYAKAGGHDPAYVVADDHELMVRTYLAGVEFVEIPEVLYYQRRHASSTCISRQGEVARLTEEIKETRLHSLIFEECRRKGLPMIDLGGGHNCPRHLGFKALDMGVGGVEYPFDVLGDEFLEKIPDDSVGCFRASDFLEHIPIGKTVELMNRLYDKLAPGGWLITATPSVAGPDGKVGLGAWQDPSHSSFWGLNNFFYFTNRDFSKYVPEIRCRFQDVTLKCSYPSDWHRVNSVPYVTADLMAVKGVQRVPGLLRI